MAEHKFDIHKHFRIVFQKDEDMECDEDPEVLTQPLQSGTCNHCNIHLDHLTYLGMKEHLKNCVAAPIAVKIMSEYVPYRLTLKERFIVLEAMKELYSNNFFFNFHIFYGKVKDVEELQWMSKERLHRSLIDAGFSLVHVEGKTIIMEDPELRFARYNYLKRIMKYRQKDKQIYYIDEIHIEIEKDTLVIRKPTAKDLSLGTFDYHPKMFFVCSVDGCKTLFSFCLGKGDYMKWIAHSLIPSLKPGSVIVMDNSFLHSSPKEAHVTRYHTKNDMIRWLETRNIPCHASMHKAELYDLIDKCPLKNDEKLDRIFKANGHETVRLPCQVHQLSMCSLMLEEIKSSLQLNPKSSNPTDRQMSHLLIKLKLSEAIKAIPTYKWTEFNLTIQNYERDFMNTDCEVEDLLDMNYNIDNKYYMLEKITTCSFCNGKEHHMKINAS